MEDIKDRVTVIVKASLMKVGMVILGDYCTLYKVYYVENETDIPVISCRAITNEDIEVTYHDDEYLVTRKSAMEHKVRFSVRMRPEGYSTGDLLRGASGDMKADMEDLARFRDMNFWTGYGYVTTERLLLIKKVISNLHYPSVADCVGVLCAAEVYEDKVPDEDVATQIVDFLKRGFKQVVYNTYNPNITSSLLMALGVDGYMTALGDIMSGHVPRFSKYGDSVVFDTTRTYYE